MKLKINFRIFIGLLVAALAVAAIGLMIPSAEAQDGSDTPLVNVGSSDEFEAFLTGPDGMTLYMFTPDDSLCVEQCLENWPPLTVESEDELSKAEGIPGTLGIFEREDGTMQVTYNDMPLYYWVNDEAPGDTTGHQVNDVWFIVEPATVYVGDNEDLGKFLVGPNGFTLYRFEPDPRGEGASACTDQCLENWPALTVENEEEFSAGMNIPGEFTFFEREDTGEIQVAYNGWPLYFWVNDEAVGDATGHEVNDVWFVVVPETVVLGGNEELGDFLVGPDGFTLYIFANDEEGVSNCVDACAENWPPLTVGQNDQLVAGEDVPGELGTIEREDGSLQVTYDGMPLYYWINDEAPGDATGHEVNDVWFVVSPEM